MIARLRRLPEVARVFPVASRLEEHEEWDLEKLRTHQRRRLLAIVRHAAARSPYYRERFAGVELSEDLDLAALPTLDKATMLEHFDQLVTDRRLTLSTVERHMVELERADPRTDPKLFGEYRVLASGGTSRRRGVFVYGRTDWREVLAGGARYGSAYLDFSPGLPRRRFAPVVAQHALHISGRAMRSADVGVARILRLDARTPVDELTQALNRFRPEHMQTYPSLAAQLAERQLAGELRIAPRLVSTSGEVRTAEMKERIDAAWPQAGFDIYISTETGYLAGECEHHAGLHVFEDQVQIEVVDDEYRPVPAGKQGSRLLVTNLFNRAQPLIRYELDDLVTVSPRPCPCGRSFSVLESVGGRSEDVLELPVGAGRSVSVHPITLHSPLNGIAAVSMYRIGYRRGELRIEAVVNGGDERRTCAEVQSRVEAALARHGVSALPVRVQSVGEIPRHPRSGKHRAIEACD